MKRSKKASMLFLAVLVLAFTGCATFVDNAYKTIFIAGTSYDAGMKSVADLQAQKIITAEQRAEINALATKFYSAYQVASVALSTYNKTKTADAEARLTVAINDLIATWKVYADAVNSFKKGTVSTEVN